MNIFFSSKKNSQTTFDLKDDLYAGFQNVMLDLFKYLDKKDIRTRELIRPEIYKHKIAFHHLEGFRKRSIHIICRPAQEIRILKEAYNIGIVLELQNLNKNRPNLKTALPDPIRQLSLLDEIWVISNHAQKMLIIKNGFENVYFVSKDKNDLSPSEEVAIDDNHPDRKMIDFETIYKRIIEINRSNFPKSESE